MEGLGGTLALRFQSVTFREPECKRAGEIGIDFYIVLGALSNIRQSVLLARVDIQQKIQHNIPKNIKKAEHQIKSRRSFFLLLLD